MEKRLCFCVHWEYSIDIQLVHSELPFGQNQCALRLLRSFAICFIHSLWCSPNKPDRCYLVCMWVFLSTAQYIFITYVTLTCHNHVQQSKQNVIDTGVLFGYSFRAWVIAWVTFPRNSSCFPIACENVVSVYSFIRILQCGPFEWICLHGPERIIVFLLSSSFRRLAHIFSSCGWVCVLRFGAHD